MMNKLVTILKIFLFCVFFSTSAYSQVINKISIKGNERISNKTILMFSNIELQDEITNTKINSIFLQTYIT